MGAIFYPSATFFSAMALSLNYVRVLLENVICSHAIEPKKREASRRTFSLLVYSTENFVLQPRHSRRGWKEKEIWRSAPNLHVKKEATPLLPHHARATHTRYDRECV